MKPIKFAKPLDRTKSNFYITSLGNKEVRDRFEYILQFIYGLFLDKTGNWYSEYFPDAEEGEIGSIASGSKGNHCEKGWSNTDIDTEIIHIKMDNDFSISLIDRKGNSISLFEEGIPLYYFFDHFEFDLYWKKRKETGKIYPTPKDICPNLPKIICSHCQMLWI